MLLSTGTSCLGKILSYKEAVKIIAKAGFDAYDISLDDLSRDEEDIFNRDDYLDIAMELKETANSLNVKCNQAHAPFPSSEGKPERDNFIFEKIVRAMEIASLLGAEIIVVHPKQHLNYAEHAEELFEIIKQFRISEKESLSVIISSEYFIYLEILACVNGDDLELLIELKSLKDGEVIEGTLCDFRKDDEIISSLDYIRTYALEEE